MNVIPLPIAQPAEDLQPEQVLIGHAMADASKITIAKHRLTDADFRHPINAQLWQLICALHAEGKQPGLQTICERMGRDTDAEPGLKLREYLLTCAKAAVEASALWMPFADCVDAMRDRSQRDAIASVGSVLSTGAAQTAMPLRDLIADAIARLDDVASSMRAGKALRYDGYAAAGAAIDHAMSGKSDSPSTGIDDLDAVIGGWPRGQLSIVAARPGMGKSAVAVSLMRQAAKAGVEHLMFSFEMTREQIGARLLTDLAYTQADPIPYQALWLGSVDERQMRRLTDARKYLQGLPLHIEEQRGITMSDVAARARKLANELARNGRRLDVIVVDHMGLVRPSSRYAGNHEREVAEISNGLATLAKELDVAVVALCQLNRAVEGRENKRAGMSDLRASGEIEQDASVIIFPYRPAYYLERAKSDDPTQEGERLALLDAKRFYLELSVAKNRNGQCDTVNLFCDIGANAVRGMRFAR